MVANWLSGHARAAFLLLAFVGCGEAFSAGGNEAGEAGASGSEGGGTAGAGGTGKGGASGAGAMSGQGGTSGAGRGGSSGVSGSGASGGDAGSDAGAGGSGTSGTGGGDSGSGNNGGTSASGGIAGVAGVGAIAGTGGIVIGPDVPTDGLLLWLRADMGVTLVDEHHVLSWADQSGNGNHVEQTGSAQQPSLVERENGLPRVEFDGIDDFMRLPVGFADFTAGLSAFIVTNARTLDYCWALLELSNGSEVDDIFLGHYATSPHYEVIQSWLTEGAYPFPDDLVLSAVHDTSKLIETRTNGSLAGDASMDLPPVVERTQNFLGRSQYEMCGVLEGSISEVLLYNRAVSSEELLAIEDYLATRWGCCRS